MAKWNAKRIAQVKAVLRSSVSIAEAARKLGVMQGSFTQSCRYHGLEPAALLRSDPTDLTAAKRQIEAAQAGRHVRVLQRRLIDAEKAAEFYSSIASAPPIKVAASRPKSGKRQGTICTCLSDWHVGERVSPEETHGRNVYDLATAKARAEQFWSNVLWLRRDIARTVDSPDHVLNLNGDLISGSIHQELCETNEVGLVDQVGHAIALIEPGIRALSKDVPGRLIVPCTHGNHGRWTEKSQIKTGWAHSLESMLYRWLRDKCADLQNVEWVIPKAESVSLEVMGLRMRFQHGTHIRSSGGIGGILVPLTRWATRQNTADLYVFGHFHQACAFGKVLVNGSLIGESAYSTEMGFEYRPPEQTNWVIDAKHGLRRFDPVSVT
jgi:transposase-like protein